MQLKQSEKYNFFATKALRHKILVTLRLCVFAANFFSFLLYTFLVANKKY